MKYQVLYNPLAGGVSAGQKPEIPLADAGLVYQDVTKISDIPAFLAAVGDDGVILCGGDGTLNHFVNDMGDAPLPCEVLYYPCGSGNDFAIDVGWDGKAPFVLNPYIEKLPTVTVNGRTWRFLNNVGFGIDGYCTEMGDKMRETSDKPVNYTSIAIRGLLGGFKPVNVRITVDGKTTEYKHAWLAPTMNGRFYGGGMQAAPAQDRLNAAHTVSAMVMFGCGKLRALIAFPSIFKGELVNRTKICHVFVGHTVDVTFDRPCALQIDGETLLGITSYHVDAWHE